MAGSSGERWHAGRHPHHDGERKLLSTVNLNGGLKEESDADDRKALDRLEMPTVVRADLEPVAQTRRCDQQVEVADRASLLPKSSALATEDPADLIVDGENRQACQELPEGGLAANRVTRVLNAFVQLGQRADAYSQAGRLQLLQPAETAATPLR
jgi:hypothetical protein